MKAERLENGMIKLAGPIWKDQFPEERLKSWIAWYDKMHEDHGHHTYKDAADALRSPGD
ncbi:hypothetical protein MACH17_22310 [Phaeobacter inhibens]|uniref:hypothetical protein n=1 Tax=Phaeobacter inhibens TaxID=221822 RepID=UPI00275D42FA|nr:hypothetical protein [Phaeobacter inhibens]GLO70714.1 hypothetical protein MACH17_22310 [Phaeobacter inhibens]